MSSKALSLSREAQAFTKKLRDPTLYQESGIVGGRHLRAKSGKSFPVRNPATGDIIGHCPDFSHSEFKEAINLTSAAFSEWKHSSVNLRRSVLQRWREECIRNENDLATLITAENGKPMHEAIAEIRYSNSYLAWYEGEAVRQYGDVIPSPDNNLRNMVIKQPVGPCAFITPWNFPVSMVTKKVGAATAAGCSSIVKPPPDTPFSVVAFIELGRRAGLPDGLINVVPTLADTKSFGEEMCSSDLIKKISFTGSTEVGKLLLKMAGQSKMIKKISLELGGNSPFIVFDDADIEKSIDGLIQGKFRANGENCVAPNRVFVQSGIYEVWMARLQAKLESFRVGDGFDPDVTHGPLIHEAQRDKVAGLVEDMRSKGADIRSGGFIPKQLSKGAFYAPTLVGNVKRNMKFWTEEIFGPVVAVTKFETEHEVIDMANDTEMGLASYVYTNNYARCWRVAEALEYGMCGVNSGMVSAAEAPFGGKKNSGLGKEGSMYGLDDYTERKLVAWGGI